MFQFISVFFALISSSFSSFSHETIQLYIVSVFLEYLPAGLPLSGKLPVLNLLTGQKSGFFAPHGRLIAPILVKLCRTDGHLGPLGCAKFHLNPCTGWECGPKISKVSTFW